MNDIERARKLLKEYKETTNTFFKMIDDYLDNTPKNASERPTSNENEIVRENIGE